MLKLIFYLSLRITVETCAAIVAASIPTLKPLFRPFFGNTNAEQYNYKGGPRSSKGYIRNKLEDRSTNNFTDFEMLGTYVSPVHISSGAPTHEGSQESILPCKETGVGSIINRTRVSISVEESRKEVKSMA